MAIQAAFTALSTTGGIVYFPQGNYPITAQLTFDTKVKNAPSIIIRGEGRNTSVIDRRGGPGYTIAIKSSTPGAFQAGLTIEDIGITTTSGTGSRSGIYIKGVWQATFRGVRVQSMTGNGIYIDSPLGDDDAAVNVTLENCYLWDNTLYGLRAVCGPGKRGPGKPGQDPAAGTSNISFLSFQSCSIQGNLQGGISWTGAGCSIRDTGIAMNGHSTEGVGGLHVDYSGASNMNLEVTSSTFENNAPRHVHVRSLLCGVFTNVDFRNSVPSIGVAIEGVRFEPAPALPPSPGFSKLGGPAAVEQITFVNPNIHVIPDVNPFTQFVLDATNGPIQGVHVEGPMWRTFEAYPPDPPVDHTRFALVNAVNIHDLQRTSPRVEGPSTLQLVEGENNIDIGLDAEEFVLTAPIPPALCTITGFANGWQGRRLTLFLVNNTDKVSLESDYHPKPHPKSVNNLLLPGGIQRSLDPFARTVLEFEYTTAPGVGNPSGWLLRSVQQ